MMDQHLFNAKLAERSGRYHEMITELQRVLQVDKVDITNELRNLLSVAYKGALAKQRFSWRILQEAAKKEHGRGMVHGTEFVRDYQKEVAREIVNLAHEGADLASKLTGKTSEPAARAHLLLLRADCARYVAEVSGSRDNAQQALRCYDDALQVGLPHEHPTNLSIVLNRAIAFYELFDDQKQAIQALETVLDNLPGTGSKRRQQMVIVSLIENNLKLWRSGKA